MRTNVNGATSTIGASTPYGHPGGRSALGNTVFVEEEDEALEMERNGRFEVWAALPIQESLEVAFMVFLEVGVEMRMERVR